ncbi:aminopeptidase [Pradoshia sp. D12]|uniref:aminopeptidase n=1 Tax=Bacillaceae TaxID=186817 RepID=UPI00080AD160|nr:MULTISPECIES: aminopeptidase [Bacillaceae]OCA90141.1 peptidase M29 [Bacillus sp. FJAT-27986]QFK70452.1 aminopeptidase [Pradoshia sp. D12]TPF72247.1 aminopeptidase [Bacillus sp. D12]
MNFEQKLNKYAELVVKVGVNIQEGQILVISSSIESASFTRQVVKKAYEAGAKHVYVDWADEEVSRIKYELAPDEAFNEFPQWIVAQREELVEKGGAFLSIVSQSPDLLKGIDPNRIASFQKAAGTALNKFRQATQSDKVSWCVTAAAGKAWADKIFPDSENSVELLWDAIFKAVRVDSEDPVAAWKEHDETLRTKADYLNSKKYKVLHYKAPGTDLSIELSDKHIWCGAGSVNSKGISFMANMPTEEVFTVPYKEGVNGTVTSTKPLSYGGNVINNFTLTFEKGKVVDVKAETGENVLKNLLDSDEGSRYLGEVALVPHQSPISDTNILFYNTLFDENASNHLAIGSGYAFCLEGGKEMNEDQLANDGVNISINHVDFMIGSAEMDIDGELADGTKEPIFRKGNWAF